jgi:hypothetical protein
VGYTFDERMAVLGPHVHDGVPLLQAASAAWVPLRTAQRWLTAYLTQGATGCVEPGERTRAGTPGAGGAPRGDRGLGPSPAAAARGGARA